MITDITTIEMMEEIAKENGWPEAVVKAYFDNFGYTVEQLNDEGVVGEITDGIADAFMGEYESEREFAEGYANDNGLLGDYSWPHDCIDWDVATRELMWDFWTAPVPFAGQWIPGADTYVPSTAVFIFRSF